MAELKAITREAIPRALERADRYRLLNEPRFAESICLDVLAIDPTNQQALVTLLLSLTDQFTMGLEGGLGKARALLPRLEGAYERAYYAGVIAERRGKAELLKNGPGSRFAAFEYIREALKRYEQAESLRAAGNDDAVLRWNTCVRMIERYRLEPAHDDGGDLPLE